MTNDFKAPDITGDAEFKHTDSFGSILFMQLNLMEINMGKRIEFLELLL